MKTSVIEVHAALSVLSVEEIEHRFRAVPGVDSTTVNFAAGNVTVRFDESRLEVADIKSAVRQRGLEHTMPTDRPNGEGTAGEHATSAATLAAATQAAPAVEDAAPNAAPTHHAPAASASADQPPSASTAEHSGTAHAAHTSPVKRDSPMPSDMAKEMGHGGNMDESRDRLRHAPPAPLLARPAALAGCGR